MIQICIGNTNEVITLSPIESLPFEGIETIASFISIIFDYQFPYNRPFNVCNISFIKITTTDGITIDAGFNKNYEKIYSIFIHDGKLIEDISINLSFINSRQFYLNDYYYLNGREIHTYKDDLVSNVMNESGGAGKFIYKYLKRFGYIKDAYLNNNNLFYAISYLNWCYDTIHLPSKYKIILSSINLDTFITDRKLLRVLFDITEENRINLIYSRL